MSRMNAPHRGMALTHLRSGAPVQFARNRRRYYAVAAVGVLGLAVCMWVVRDGDVSDIERTAFDAVNGLPNVLRTPMWVFQIFGSLAFVALAALAALAIRRYRLGIALGLAIPLKFAIEWWLVKALIERERPFLSVPDAVIREINSSPLGFPSGHAIFAFVLAGLLAPYVGRRGMAIVYSLAALNGLARIYLGAHNPLDVIAGAFLGLAIAAGLNLLVQTPELRRGTN